MNTVCISIKAGEELQEILISLLSDFGATGFEQQEDRLLAYFPENNFDSYEVNRLIKDYEHSTGILEEQNWNEVWEKNFPPVLVDDFCSVRAEFHPPAEDIPYELVISPKMSFGTGHHATTWMMISQMRRIDFREKKVLDFGTGTGILAILAEKLGASQITAMDVDEWSIENAKENCQRNYSNRIQLLHGSELPAAQFDIILANINRNVILEYMQQLTGSIVSGGLILFSGLLVADGEKIIETSEGVLELVKTDERQNWLSLLFIKS